MKTVLFSSQIGDVPANLAFKNNFAATAAPGVGDDSADGYEVGSTWIDVTANLAYTCVDATEGAAIWNLTGDSGIDPAELALLNGASAGVVVNSKAAAYGAAGNLAHSKALVTAIGTNLAGAAAMTADSNIVSAADGAKGVKLPVAVLGDEIRVVNTGAAVLKVYPVSGSQINGLGASAAFSLAPLREAVFVATSTTQWYCAGAAAISAFTATDLTATGNVALGDATSDTLGFYGHSPAAQQASASQAAYTGQTFTAVATTVFSAVGTGALSGIWGFASSTVAKTLKPQINKLITDVGKVNTLLLEIRTNLVALGLIKGAA